MSNLVPETVYQAPNVGSWLENLAITPDNKILTTRLDVPELWLIDPTAKSASKVHTFPNANGLTGIAQFSKDIYAVTAMTIELATATVSPNSSSIWKVDMTNEKYPSINLLAAIPEVSFPNGLATWDEETILIADSVQGAVYSVNTKTGAYNIVIKDPSMLPAAGAPVKIGINGIKRFGDYVYYTSSTQELFARIPMTKSSTHIIPTGPVEVLSSGTFADDFAIHSGDGTAFLAGNVNNQLFKLPLGGAISVFAGAATSLEVAGCTSVGFAKHGEMLYVATTGALGAPVNGTAVEPAKIVRFILNE